MSLSTILVITPIIIFSILAVAIVIDRFKFLYKNRINLADLVRPDETIVELTDKINNGNKSSVNDTLRSFANSNFTTKEELNEFVDAGLSYLYLEYSKKVNYLGIFARLSTLLGLFGTVLGMISAFNNIVEKGISNAAIVAEGISTALITTAVGLIVAIPTTFFHDFFERQIEAEIKKIEIVVSTLFQKKFRKRIAPKI